MEAAGVYETLFYNNPEDLDLSFIAVRTSNLSCD
jgi:hypothetical protein